LGNMAAVALVHEFSLKKALEGYTQIVEKGKIVLLEDDNGEAKALEDVVPGGEGYLDEHPEGADRGGYVPTVFLGRNYMYWDKENGGWY